MCIPNNFLPNAEIISFSPLKRLRLTLSIINHENLPVLLNYIPVQFELKRLIYILALR